MNNQIGSHKTTVMSIIKSDDNLLKTGIKVNNHETTVLQFNDHSIILNSDGWRTQTTKRRINQASKQFGLNLNVYQKNKKWYIDYDNKTILFHDGIELQR